jgi:S1-C subfamily serine protease
LYRLLALAALAFATACSTLDGGAVDSAAASAVLVQIGPLDAVSHGSGVVIAKGRVLTAGHVALAGLEVGAMSVNGKSVTDGEIGDMEAGEDYAILDVDTGSLKPAAYTCETPKAGTEVFTYGNPLILKDVATFGHVASNHSLDFDEAPKGGVLLDMTVLPGNSGGAVFVMKAGRPTVVGIVVQLVPFRMGSTTLSIMLPLSSTSLCS